MPSNSATDSTFFGVTPIRSSAGPAGGNSMPSGISIHCWMRSSWHYVLPAAPDVKLADHRGVGAPQDFDDLAIGAAIGFDARDANHHAVSVHGLLRRVGWNEDVALYPFQRPLGYQKPIAIAVHVQAPHREFPAAGCNRILAAPKLQQIAARNQAHQRGFQLLALLAPGAQFANQLFEISPGVRQLTNVFQQNRVRHTQILLATPAKLVTSLRADDDWRRMPEYLRVSCPP